MSRILTITVDQVDNECNVSLDFIDEEEEVRMVAAFAAAATAMITIQEILDKPWGSVIQALLNTISQKVPTLATSVIETSGLSKWTRS